MPVKAGYLIAASGGAILLWSGVKGKKWSTVLRDVISGKPIGTATDNPITGTASSSAAGGFGGGTIPAGGAVSTGKNVALGKTLAAGFGWVGVQFDALNHLWTGESGWNNRAQNASSGAYGIPQALPGSKMGALANPPISSATAQILWGLRYIRQRYGNPVNAYNAWLSRSPHWY